MKNLSNLFRLFYSASLMSAFLVVGCVEDKCDLSKDIDVTIGVGKGVSIPIGSTEKIMLTELMDSADSEILRIDSEGDYSIFKAGNFTPEYFKVGNLDVDIEPFSDKMHYDFKLFDLTDEIDELPSWVKEEMMKQKYPYVVNQKIDYKTTFKIDQSVPEEMLRLRKLSFSNDAKMSVKVKIASSNSMSDNLLETLNYLYIGSNDAPFVVDIPEYMVLADKNIGQGQLKLDGKAAYNKATKSIEYVSEYEIEALDFSNYKNGYLQVNNSVISIDETLEATGYMVSDTVMFALQNLTHIQSVDVEILFAIDKMTIESVEGVFVPEIDPIKEVVDLELGEDLDFLKDSYLDFNDPRIFVTFTNPVDAKIFADAEFVGYDDSGNSIDGSKVDASMTLEGATTNRIFINRYATQLQGYTTLQVPNLNNLVKTIPDRVDVNVNARMDDGNFSSIELGKEYGISGSYEVSVPLMFDGFSLVYTETIEDVFGDEADDITDYLKDVESLTLTFNVLNTVPAELVTSVLAYDEAGNRLNSITADVVGVVAAGNGMEGSVVTEPVESSVVVKISSLNGELERLHDIGITLEGKGKGKLNANEYIRFMDIAVTIDENLSLDLN